MPIKLKKTDIQNDLDDPVEGYVILGFDETGRLVSKDSEGTYGTIVPTVPTGDFDNIRANYLTIGNRTTPFDELTFGFRSFSIGNNNEVSSINSSAQGINLIVTGENSHAQGSNIEVNGDNSFGGGFGPVANRIKVDGASSFAFFRSDDVTEDYGIDSNDSAILGGLNHRITSGGGSVILGGVNNTISGNNIVVLGSNNITANEPNSVYAPKLILSSNTADSAPNGTIRWNGSNFQGYNGAWVNLDTSVVNLGAGDVNVNTFTITNTAGSNVTIPSATNTQAGLITATTQTIYGGKTFTNKLKVASTGTQLELGSPTDTEPTMLIGRRTGHPSIKSIDTASGGWLMMDGAGLDGKVGVNFYSSGDVLLANGGGNVGIKSSSPNNTLDVTGTIGATGRISTDIGFLHEYKNLSVPGSNMTINCTQGLHWNITTTINQNINFNMNNLFNGMNGIILLRVTGGRNISFGDYQYTDAQLAERIFNSGTWSSLNGWYVITWTAFRIGTLRDIYLNINEYVQF